MAVVLLSFAAAWGLAELMAVGWAFLIVAVVWAVAGALLYLRGRDQLQKCAPQAGTNDRHTEGGRPVGEESEALKADIEDRRESMTGTIDAIEDRVVPSRIIERRKNAARGWVGDVKERVMGTTGAASGQAGSTVGKIGDGVSAATDAVTNAPAQVQRGHRRVRH